MLKKGVLETFNFQTHYEKNSLAFLQVLVQKTLLREGAQMTESRRQIQAPQKVEVWTPRYIAKQRPTAEPELNPEPATNLTERLAEETVHGHAPIHSWSVNIGLTVSPIVGGPARI